MDLLDLMQALRTRGAEVVPEFFMDGRFADGRSLGSLRADREFVALQLSIQSSRRVYLINLNALSAQTNTVLTIVGGRRP